MNKLSRNKTATFALLLILSIVTSVFASAMGATFTYKGVVYTNLQPSGSIRLPAGITPDKEYEPVPRLNLTPDPVQLNTQLLINGWLSPALSPARYHTDYQFVVTKPDGTVTTYLKDSFRADGTAWLTIKPDQVGIWMVQFNFPGSYWPPGNYTYPEAQGGYPVSFPNSVYFKPTTKTMNFTVVDEPLANYPDQPLPTDYWTRPVGPDQRNWWPILGWYPADGVTARPETEIHWPDNTNKYAQSRYGFIPFTQAPLSAHVVNFQANAIGGLMGADMEGISYPHIDRQFAQYIRPQGPDIVYNGVAYTYRPVDIRAPPRDSDVTREFPNSPYGTPKMILEATDLRTGKVLFQRDDVTQPPTMVTYWEGYPEIEGAIPLYSRYVWLTAVGSGRLINYYPSTGTPVFNVSIAPLSTGILYTHKPDPFNPGAGRVPFFLSVQNLGNSIPVAQRYRLIEWTVVGTGFRRSAVHNVTMRVASNITWPWPNLGNVYDFETMTAFRNVEESSIYTTGTAPSGLDAAGSPNNNYVQAASLITGQQLWNKSTGIHHILFSGSSIVADQGKVAFRYTDGFFYGFDQLTGEQVWRTNMTTDPWGAFVDYGVGSYGGNIIAGQADGVAAFDWETGKLAWHFKAIQPYQTETNYQGYTPFFGGSPLIADGVVFYANAIHTVKQPLPRGWKLYAMNATTGEYIWSIAGTRSHQQGSTFIDPLTIGDGYLSFPNGADGRTYVIGKGQSKTTVSAQQSGARVGDITTITGTVTDQSPSQPDTPAISDRDQGRWMEYLHMNYERPDDATGVPVIIEVIDSNNNRYQIGNVTSDISGSFGLSWQPIIPGKYQVIASFKGSNSYGSSEATTYFTASEAPAPNAEPAQPPPSMADQYFVPAVVSIIIAIAIGFAITIIVLKKRP